MSCSCMETRTCAQRQREALQPISYFESILERLQWRIVLTHGHWEPLSLVFTATRFSTASRPLTAKAAGNTWQGAVSMRS